MNLASIEPASGAATTVLIPVTEHGDMEPRFGRAPRVAVATVVDGIVTTWREYAVGWDAAHDAGTPGSHHARIVRFLNDHRVDTIVAEHMGVGMRRVVDRMGIRLLTVPGGAARQAVSLALASAEAARKSPH
ncbi:NifB/NifX family molybdenum-iron cluster-binding protein [Actinomyces qiguomingii]|uniref:NifB/NifX family molybdenum-iron cluster-binding protein n=1 Tax=Actinomyces qiguomingii TaxID=2057800 RepID=UPI0018EB2104|nr:NifB/NifX family molybdenum-iron cluster-binding protein [Actinomyces qiguomingii]